MNKERVWKLFGIIGTLFLGMHFLIRLVDFRKIIQHYPFSTEAVTQLTQLFFLKVCGFHEYCPYWYNGFESFVVTPPGWYFLTYPFLLLFGDVRIASFVSFISLYIVAFVIFYFFGKYMKLDPWKRFVFFVFFFGNNIAIKLVGNVRGHELAAWVGFSLVTFIVFLYKESKIDKYFVMAIIPAYGFTMLAHQSIGVLATVVLIGLLIAKRKEEAGIVAGCIGTAVVLVSFWLFPAAMDAIRNVSTQYKGVEAWWMFRKWTFTRIAVFALPLLSFISFRYYLKQTKEKNRTFLFFLPILGVLFLFMLGILRFIPVFMSIFTYMYFMLAYFFIMFFSLQLKGLQERVVNGIIGVSAIVLMLISLAGTPFFQEPGIVDDTIVELGEEVSGTYLFVGEFPKTSLVYSYYGYFAIYENKTSLLGWAPHIKDAAYNAEFVPLKRWRGECSILKEKSEKFAIEYVFGYDSVCKGFEMCGLDIIEEKEDVCLYKFDHKR